MNFDRLQKSALKLLFRISKPKATTKRKVGATDTTSSALEPPEKIRKVAGGTSAPIMGTAFTKANGSEGKSGSAKGVNKAKSSTPTSAPTPVIRVSPPSPAAPQSPRTTSQPAKEVSKSGERSASQSAKEASKSGERSASQPAKEASKLGERSASQPAKGASKSGERSASQLAKEVSKSGERSTSQLAKEVSKSGERSTSQPVSSPVFTSQKTGHQPPVSTAAQSPKTEKSPKLDKPPPKVVSKPKTPRPEPTQRTSNAGNSQANQPTQVAKPQAKSPAVRLSQVTIKSGQKVQKSTPQQPSSTPVQKPAVSRPPGTQLGHSYLACKMAMKLAASAASLKTASNVRSVSVGNITRDESTDVKKNLGVNSATKVSNGTSAPVGVSETATAVVSAMPTKPSVENKMPPPRSENGGTSNSPKVKQPEKKPLVNKVDCSVQTVPVYRIHSSKQNAVKSAKTSSHGTNTLLSTTSRKTQSVEQKSDSKPENASKPVVVKPAPPLPIEAKEKPTAKVVVSRPAAGVLDLSTHPRETSSASGIGAAKDSKTIFVISGTKKSQSSNKIQSIVESLAQKRMMSSSPTQSQNGSEVSTTPSKSPPPAVSKAPSVNTNGTFVAPSPVPARSTAVTPVRPVSSPLHIETASLGLRFGSSVPPLSGLPRPAPSSTTSSSSRPVFPVPPLPQRPKSQSVRSIPNPSLVRQRSAEERARDCGKGSPTAGSTAPAMSPPSIRDIHSLTRQLQEAGTSVTITNNTC